MSVRTVLISGGNRGLGQALVKAFLDDGHFVATFSRSSSPFVDALLLDSELKNRFVFKALDLSDRQGITSFVRELRGHCPPLGILINNAAVAMDGLLATQPESDIDKMLSINLGGTVALTKLCIREMLLSKWGRVITITSIVGLRGYRGLSTYSLTKAGLDGFTRSLAREMGDRGITVNSIAPGFLETDMTHGLSVDQKTQIIRRTPVGRLGQSADVVDLVRFLSSENASFISGQTIVVDGGLTA